MFLHLLVSENCFYSTFFSVYELKHFSLNDLSCFSHSFYSTILLLYVTNCIMSVYFDFFYEETSETKLIHQWSISENFFVVVVSYHFVFKCITCKYVHWQLQICWWLTGIQWFGFKDFLLISKVGLCTHWDH